MKQYTYDSVIELARQDLYNDVTSSHGVGYGDVGADRDGVNLQMLKEQTEYDNVVHRMRCVIERYNKHNDDQCPTEGKVFELLCDDLHKYCLFGF